MAKPTDFIDAAALAEALEGHRDRVALHGVKPIHRIVAALQVDAEKFVDVSEEVAGRRGVPAGEGGPYIGGFVDGFVIGVRAARAAAAASEGEQ